MTKVGALVAAVLLASALAGCGGASSPRDELSKFVVGYIDNNKDNCCELGMHAAVTDVTFARGTPRWAVVSLAITNAEGKPDGRDFVVARKIAATWHVLGFGKVALGCFVPSRIRAELATGAPEGVLGCGATG